MTSKQKKAAPAYALTPNFIIERPSGTIEMSDHMPPISRYGGDIKEYTKKRWFDDPSKLRVVEISIEMFYSIGKHYYVTMKECSNPLLAKANSKYGPVWGSPFHDDDRPMYWSNKFDSDDQARAYISKTLIEHYGTKKKVIISLRTLQGAKELKWFYKDGD